MPRFAHPLTQTQSFSLSPSFPPYGQISPHEPCVKFLTETKNGRPEVILLSLARPVTIGRHRKFNDYVIEEAIVSNMHCKLWVTQTDNSGVLVSCEDNSTNGLLLNGYRIRKTSVILTHNDIIQIPGSQTFRCVYVSSTQPRPKRHPFDDHTQASRAVEDYIVLPHCLGTGSFGEVHLAMDPRMCRQVACKTVRVAKEKATTPGAPPGKQKAHVDMVMREVQVMMKLNHPNIVQVYHACRMPSEKLLYIFMQLCTGGDLFTYLCNHRDTGGHLGEGEAKYIMYQLIQGLIYLHDRNIAHRDIKPENLLLYTPGSYPRILIADFGLARPRSMEETMNVCGTIAYLSPEAIIALDTEHIGYRGMPSDCWSAGVILYIMLTGYHPFDQGVSTWNTYHELFGSDTFYNKEVVHANLSQVHVPFDLNERSAKERIKAGAIHFDPGRWINLDDAKTLVRQLLVQDPQGRASARDTLNCDWFFNDIRDLEIAFERNAQQHRASQQIGER